MYEGKHPLACPICDASENTSGRPFSSFRAVSLHIGGKAKSADVEHLIWILDILPGIDFKKSTLNQVGEQIEFYVREAAQSAEIPEDVEEELQENQASVPHAGMRTEKELEQYMEAYKLLWVIESRLFLIVSHELRAAYGDAWVQKGFPLATKQDCTKRAHEDGNVVSSEYYVYLKDIGDVVSSSNNKKVFTQVFDPLRQHYTDVSSRFHSLLRKVNVIRNAVMHPMKHITPGEEEMKTLQEMMEFMNKWSDARP